MNIPHSHGSGSYPGFFPQTTPSEHSGTQLYFQPGLRLRPLPRSALELDDRPEKASRPSSTKRSVLRFRVELVAVGVAAATSFALLVRSWLRLWWLA